MRTQVHAQALKAMATQLRTWARKSSDDFTDEEQQSLVEIAGQIDDIALPITVVEHAADPS